MRVHICKMVKAKKDKIKSNMKKLVKKEYHIIVEAKELANTVPHNKHRYQGIITALKEAFGRPEVIMDQVIMDLLHLYLNMFLPQSQLMQIVMITNQSMDFHQENICQ